MLFWKEPPFLKGTSSPFAFLRPTEEKEGQGLAVEKYTQAALSKGIRWLGGRWKELGRSIVQVSVLQADQQNPLGCLLIQKL